MQTGLARKTVLITGAASGIGKATAIAFAKEGAHVVMIDNDEAELRNAAELVAHAGAAPIHVTGDLSTLSGVEGSIDAVLARLPGGLDILVNNVGFADPKPFMELSDEHWERTFQVNFMSAVRVTRKLLPALRERDKAVIINNTSDLGRQPEAAPADYGALKAALIALTKSLARSEGPKIRVNAVAPGPIWTPFWSRPGGFADALSSLHDLPPRQAVDHEMKLRQLPLERLGEPEEVANVIVFLASDLASFVSSSVWGIDGGSIRSLL
ncbi:MAG TPA: SDR family oxidoreductase [Acidobacteriaceae bacterium]|jgi:3-oxoacyl-[acyl-carrier protein] reductase|nr:SDR family oxidoreductase [Acidobacteriaceae bacterium]